MPRFAVLAGVFGLIGCEPPPAVFSDVLPDERLILYEDELLPRGIATDLSEWATWLYEEAHAANRRHIELVLLVEAVTVLPANWRDRGEEHAVQWGPWIIDGVAERLWVEQRASDTYDWAVERQEVDVDRVRFDDEAWISDLAGTIDVERGDPLGGSLVLDVDEVGFGAINAAMEAYADEIGTEDPLGTLDDAFIDEGPIGRAALRYDLTEAGGTFTTIGNVGDVDTVPEIGGTTFDHHPGEGGTVWTTFDEDRNDDGFAETITVVAQWSAEGGGRADVVTTGPAGTVSTSECWNGDHHVTYASGPPETRGDPTSCLFMAL